MWRGPEGFGRKKDGVGGGYKEHWRKESRLGTRVSGAGAWHCREDVGKGNRALERETPQLLRKKIEKRRRKDVSEQMVKKWRTENAGKYSRLGRAWRKEESTDVRAQRKWKGQRKASLRAKARRSNFRIRVVRERNTRWRTLRNSGA